jgi:hypothetical protein
MVGDWDSDGIDTIGLKRSKNDVYATATAPVSPISV